MQEVTIIEEILQYFDTLPFFVVAMAFLDLISKFCKKYIFNLESIILFCFIFVIYNYIFNAHIVWNFFEKLKVRFELRLTGEYDKIPTNPESIISAEKTKASWELKKDHVGVYAIQGRRPHMEDRFNVVNDLEHTDTSIYGIFDGHGGEFASDFTEKTLFKSLMIRLMKSQMEGSGEENISQILTEEILNVDSQLLELERSTYEVSGTTALVALVRKNILTVANVGDSRGVLCSSEDITIPLSFDHKPQQLKERKRIKRAGGFISFNGVWRVAGVLATSRALGDLPLKDKNLVIAEPDILTFDLSVIKPKFLILATDGLWDVFTNEEAVQYILDRLEEPHYGAKSLVLQAYYRGSMDNITVMVVNFNAQTVVKVERKGSNA